MDENNNNQAPESEVPEETNVIPNKHSDPRLIVVVVVLILVLVGVVVTILGKTPADPMVSEPTVAIPPPPEKISTGETLPESFPKDLILEEGIKISEGYSINYDGLIQSTGNLFSTKTVAENYQNYQVYLEEEGWTMTNSYQSESLSFLYATKDSKQISVTISAGEIGGSQMTVSVLE